MNGMKDSMTEHRNNMHKISLVSWAKDSKRTTCKQYKGKGKTRSQPVPNETRKTNDVMKHQQGTGNIESRAENEEIDQEIRGKSTNKVTKLIREPTKNQDAAYEVHKENYQVIKKMIRTRQKNQRQNKNKAKPQQICTPNLPPNNHHTTVQRKKKITQTW